MRLNDIQNIVKVVNDVHQAKKIRLDFLKQEIDEKQLKKLSLQEANKLLEQVRVFLQELAEFTRDQIMSGLQEVVTLCLQSIFGPDISFEIEVGTLRNNTSIEFYVVSREGDQIVRLKPEDAMGGGVIDTVAIGLRFGLLKVLNPTPIGPVILDEPAKMVSADRIDSIGLLIKDLSRIFGKQILMVTHHHQLTDIADHYVWIEKQAGVSNVKKGDFYERV
jgi:DNA repair exonuclease SbcCD ATPase subunit